MTFFSKSNSLWTSMKSMKSDETTQKWSWKIALKKWPVPQTKQSTKNIATEAQKSQLSRWENKRTENEPRLYNHTKRTIICLWSIEATSPRGKNLITTKVVRTLPLEGLKGLQTLIWLRLLENYDIEDLGFYINFSLLNSNSKKKFIPKL